MKRKTSLIIILTIVIAMIFSFTAFADTGPKPSVNIEIDGAKGKYYVTLLSKYESTGPSSVYDPDSGFDYARYKEGDAEYEIWKKFVDYVDPDGFFFVQEFSLCEDGKYVWGYYPPRIFKVLIYFPESDTFVASGINESYAFDSYYKMTLSDNDGMIVSEKLEKNYAYGAEILSLIARIIITLAIEVGIAVIFKLTAKKQLIFITVINAVTNTLLNVALNLINYYEGEMMFTAMYVLFELAVFVIEAILYFFFLGKFSQKTQKRGIYVAYAFAANLISFGGGLLLAHIIPGIF